MDDKFELLINLVQGYPHLYDKSSMNFKDLQMKENSWQQISEALGISAKDCQRIWTNLRNKYGREKKALPSGSGAPATPQWEYLDSMYFLNSYVKPRKTHTKTPIVQQKPQPTVTSPLLSPILMATSSGCSSQNSMLMSPQSNYESEVYDSQEESMNEDFLENIVIEIQEPEQPRPTAEPASKAKRKNIKNTADNERSNEVIDAANSITAHLKNISERKPESKTVADAFGQYVASVLREMTPEQQKIKRRRLLEVLEDD